MIENFLDSTAAQDIASTLMSNSFPWYYQRSSTAYESVNKMDRPWLFHVFTYEQDVVNSDYAEMINERFDPLFQLVKQKPEQIRASMEIQQTPGMTFFHRDRSYEHFSCIYYVVTATGNTVFGSTDSIEITPQFNSIVIFDGSIEHCNRFPDASERCIINFIFKGPFPQHLLGDKT